MMYELHPRTQGDDLSCMHTSLVGLLMSITARALALMQNFFLA